MPNKNITINITTGTFFRVGFIVLLAVTLYLIRDILIVVFMSIVIASGVEPVALWFQKRKIPRVPAVIIVYLLGFFIFGSLFYLVIPTIFSEFFSFSSQVTSLFSDPSSSSFFKEITSLFPLSVSGLLQNFTEQAMGYVSGFTVGFFHTAAKIFGGAFSFILVVIISFYLSVQEKGIENFLRIIIPIKYENYTMDLWKRVRDKIGKWLQGQILLGIIVAVLIFLGLTILRVDYALTFALLAGVFELIPVFGPILSSIPPIMMGLAQDPVLALKVLILFVIVQQFENHLIYPLVVRKIVGIPPIMTILSLIIGAKLAGFPGILLSVPVATIIVEIMNDIEQRKKTVIAP